MGGKWMPRCFHAVSMTLMNSCCYSGYSADLRKQGETGKLSQTQKKKNLEIYKGVTGRGRTFLLFVANVLNKLKWKPVKYVLPKRNVLFAKHISSLLVNVPTKKNYSVWTSLEFSFIKRNSSDPSHYCWMETTITQK